MTNKISSEVFTGIMDLTGTGGKKKGKGKKKKGKKVLMIITQCITIFSRNKETNFTAAGAINCVIIMYNDNHIFGSSINSCQPK